MEQKHREYDPSGNVLVYDAFGLCIRSEIPFPAPMAAEGTPVDASIRLARCPVFSGEAELDLGWLKARKGETRIEPEKGIAIVIRNGNEILIEKDTPEAGGNPLNAFVFGLCMAELLLQRGIHVLHGSCLVKDGKGLLITGGCHSGKSTLSFELLNRGWKLMSDDLVAVTEEDGIFYAWSSFAGQKMWDTSVKQFQIEDRITGVLFETDTGKTKYSIDASRQFEAGRVRLDGGIFLIPGAEKLCLHEVKGFAGTDLLMRNTPQKYHVLDSRQKSGLLSDCIRMAKQMRLFVAERPDDVPTVCEIADWLIGQIQA